MHVSLRAKAVAILSVMTGSAFHIIVPVENDADAKADAELMSTNVALTSALLLTLVVPIVFDSIYGAQTNAHMVTDPAWVGISFFFLLFMATLFFWMSVAYAILTILVTRRLSTPSESRYLFTIARAEFVRPVQYAISGSILLLSALLLFLIIAFFNLSAVDECEPSLPSSSALSILSLNVSSDTHSQECRWYPELFIALACGGFSLAMMFLNSASNVR